MSQKIIIPKGTIDSSHTTIIEIPNYLHETSTVVVTTPKTTDSSIEQSWEANEEYFEGPEQNETDWGQEYEAQEVNDEEYAPDQQDQYTGNVSEDPESGNEVQQVTEDGAYVEYVEESSTQPTRRPKFDAYPEPMRRRILDKKRELLKMHAERQKMREGESETYETAPDTENVEDALRMLSEVPREMRGRSQTRERNFEKEKKRRMHEFEKSQACSAQAQPGYHQPRYHVRDQTCSSLKSQQYMASPQPTKQQWNQVHPHMQYARQGQPTMQTPAGPQRRQMTGQVGFAAPEEARQQYQPRRKPAFHIPRN